MIFDLSRLTARPSRSAVSHKMFNWFCKPHTVHEAKITSSANIRMKICTRSGVNWMPCLPRSMISLASSSMNIENKIGLHISHCFRPPGHMKESVRSLPDRTLAFTTLYIQTGTFSALHHRFVKCSTVWHGPQSQMLFESQRTPRITFCITFCVCVTVSVLKPLR